MHEDDFWSRATEPEERVLVERERAFVEAMNDDLLALGRMLDGGMLEEGRRRIGAEQEMFLIDGSHRPAPIAAELHSALDEAGCKLEAGRFSFEVNLTPQLLTGNCLTVMERELELRLDRVAEVARELGAGILLTGILPTVEPADLDSAIMLENPRYFELDRALTRRRGRRTILSLDGDESLRLDYDGFAISSLLSSFQLHLQVDASSFARSCNAAHLVAAPLLAAAVNSPLLLGRRLWRETRIPAYQHAGDDRAPADRPIGDQQILHTPRVAFGEDWVRGSAIAIFREEIERFQPLMAAAIEFKPGQGSLRTLEAGQLPALRSLLLHHSTVWRWIRPCYGVTDGIPHLRIEMRPLPAGPTVIDQMANAAFFYGLMLGMAWEYGDFTTEISMAEARLNFYAAARQGLDAQFVWPGQGRMAATRLILDHLLPLARRGLAAAGIEASDIDRLCDILGERVATGRTGAGWIAQTLSHLEARMPRRDALALITATMARYQRSPLPVHRWPAN